MKKYPFLIAGTLCLALIGVGASCNSNDSTSSGQSFSATDSDWSIGPADARVTIIEYADFQCPGCRNFYLVMEAIRSEFPNDLRYIYRHYPLSYHPDAERAAEFTEEAGAQGKFWEAYQELFTTTTKNSSGLTDLSEAKLLEIARELGLNIDQVSAALADNRHEAAVKADTQSIDSQGGLAYTPYLIINGEPYARTQADLNRKGLDYTKLRDTINEILDN